VYLGACSNKCSNRPGGGDLDPHRHRADGGSRELRGGEPMRRYDDPVEVRRGVVPGSDVEGPAQFLWRGRLWKVRAVVAHWMETAPWWQSAGARAVVGTDDPVRSGGVATAELLVEREVWR